MVTCRILANNASSAVSPHAGKSTGAVVIVELIRKNGTPQKVLIVRAQDFSMNFGDRIRSIAGTAVVMINPGTKAGAFILSAQAPNNNWKHRTELEINEETTRILNRGAVSKVEDIGNLTRGTGAVTR